MLWCVFGPIGNASLYLNIRVVQWLLCCCCCCCWNWIAGEIYLYRRDSSVGTIRHFQDSTLHGTWQGSAVVAASGCRVTGISSIVASEQIASWCCDPFSLAQFASMDYSQAIQRSFSLPSSAKASLGISFSLSIFCASIYSGYTLFSLCSRYHFLSPIMDVYILCHCSCTNGIAYCTHRNCEPLSSGSITHLRTLKLNCNCRWMAGIDERQRKRGLTKANAKP